MPVGAGSLPVAPWTQENPTHPDWVLRNIGLMQGDPSWPDGWYFYDETHDMHGPFNTHGEAASLLQEYCDKYL